MEEVESMGDWDMQPATMRLCLCFFFQAEDGIRDLTVTGVQTCALPIFRVGGFIVISKVSIRGAFMGICCPALPGWNRGCPRPVGGLARGAHSEGDKPPGRSEERRVGKECRSRWSPYH